MSSILPESDGGSGLVYRDGEAAAPHRKEIKKMVYGGSMYDWPSEEEFDELLRQHRNHLCLFEDFSEALIWMEDLYWWHGEADYLGFDVEFPNKIKVEPANLDEILARYPDFDLYNLLDDAIGQYNEKNGKDFGLQKIVKANRQRWGGGGGFHLYVTFLAGPEIRPLTRSRSGDRTLAYHPLHTFEAVVYRAPPWSTKSLTRVRFCRIKKPTASPSNHPTASSSKD